MDQNMCLWDIQAGPLIKTIPGSKRGNNCICVNWDQMVCATGDEDGMVFLWGLETNACKKSWHCNHAQTLCIDVNWEQGLLVTGSGNDRRVQSWDLEGNRLREFFKPRRMITQVRVTG